jgi:hypothetical protein
MTQKAPLLRLTTGVMSLMAPAMPVMRESLALVDRRICPMVLTFPP